MGEFVASLVLYLFTSQVTHTHTNVWTLSTVEVCKVCRISGNFVIKGITRFRVFVHALNVEIMIWGKLRIIPLKKIFPQTGAWLGFVLCLPCLVSASCFAPESPRLLLVKEDKTGCVDSLQWLRGHLSDLAGEFSRIEDSLLLALGSR